MKKNTPNSIAQNIKRYRLANNLTQESLAELLELDTQYYAQLERGERNFTLERIVSLCGIFHVGIEDIVEIPSKENPDTSQLLQKLYGQLPDLTHSQLFLVERFITELLPYTK